MTIRLQLRARDVTQIPESRPAPDPNESPERAFAIVNDSGGYRLEYDGRRATVPNKEIRNLLIRVSEGTSIEWRSSSDPEIQTTFRPLNRILQCLNSTPAYQLFLAGFHIADAIGMFDLEQVQESSIADSFNYLVGNLMWTNERKGRLFFLPEGYVTPEVEMELLANTKIVGVDLIRIVDDQTSHVGHKLYVPYATPIGFSTRVSQDTQETWRKINNLMSRQAGGAL